MTPRPSWAALGAVLLTCACGGGSSSPAKSSSHQTINDGGTVDATGKASVDVTATNFHFSPSTINGTPGQLLKLVVHNTSQTEHNVSQSAQGVNTDIEGGDTKTVTLTLPATGRLVFICKYHASRGMAGSVGAAGASLPSSGTSSTSGDNPYG